MVVNAIVLWKITQADQLLGVNTSIFISTTIFDGTRRLDRTLLGLVYIYTTVDLKNGFLSYNQRMNVDHVRNR